MTTRARTLRSGKEFNPWTLGHVAQDVDISQLLDQAPPLPSDPSNTAAPLVLPADFATARPPAIKSNPPPKQKPAEEANIPLGPSRLEKLGAFVAKAESRSASISDSGASGPSPPIACLQAKRARERARKKLKVDNSRGAEASRRADFVLRSLQVAHDDFILTKAIHSTQGYVGVPDHGLDWHDQARSKNARYTYLREVGGYLLVNTTKHTSVDYPFVDGQDRVWAVALAEPANWTERRAGIQTARDRLDARLAHLKAPRNRRGDFRAYQSGFSFGMGRTVPMNFVNTPVVEEALAEFYADSNVQALFSYVEGGLRTWFPEHYDSFQEAIKAVQKIHPVLVTPVPGCSFAALTVNIGERVVCLPHRDASNQAAGVCLDYVDGPFNPDEGGHLVFHEARCIVKLRRGGAILFPSAIITHENIDIPPMQSRFSVTAYLAGALSRYLNAGGRTLTKWKAVDAEAAAKHEAEGSTRWETGCAMFKTTEQLIQYWEERARTA